MLVLKEKKLFQKATITLMAFFLGFMGYVAYVAETRKSGSTGIDAAQIQKIRSESLQEQFKEKL